jgi:hypothetical protein
MWRALVGDASNDDVSPRSLGNGRMPVLRLFRITVSVFYAGRHAGEGSGHQFVESGGYR